MERRTIALSYRRDDTAAITGRLFDRLAAHFGREAVFRDIDSISPGSDFRLQVEHAMATCGVVVAVIGRAWRGPSRGGRARIEEEVDPVRIEIETAMRRGVPVLPVLIGPAKMPAPGQLPASLESLAFRHACRIDPGEDFDHHADRLVREIERLVSGSPVGAGHPAPRPEPSLADPRALSGDPPRSRTRATDEYGGYARSSLSHYPGTYLVVRPAFGTSGHLYAYLADISWDEEEGCLAFRERSRRDPRHSQTGRIWIPSPSDYLYLVSARDGWLRSITLSFLDDGNRMRGLISTLHNVGGARYVPVAAPIVFVKNGDLPDEDLGEIAPDHPRHADLAALLRETLAEGSARLVAP